MLFRLMLDVVKSDEKQNDGVRCDKVTVLGRAPLIRNGTVLYV